jgi:hypothetical protein
MAFSIKVTVVLTTFLILGMILAGLVTQPKASTVAWDIKETDFPSNGSTEGKLQFLLQYAILAPSSYNAQPWRFSVNGSEVLLFADETRQLTVADADQRELYISLGSALENLLLAAEHFGYSCRVTYLSGEKDLVATVNLIPIDISMPPGDARLFGAILDRSSNSNSYEIKPVPESVFMALRNQSKGEGILVYVTGDSG